MSSEPNHNRQKNHKALTKKQKEAIRRKKRQRKIILLVVEILVVLILAIALFLISKLGKIERQEVPLENIEVNEGISEESKEIMKSYTTIALFGLDNRSNGNLSKGRSDVIMIANINCHGGEPFTLARDEAYIGVLIDDLVFELFNRHILDSVSY